MSEPRQAEPWRLATVWSDDWTQSLETLDALCRWADVSGAEVALRHFRVDAPAFRRDVITPLRHWQPHGVVLHYSDWPRVRRLRRMLPGVPFVATLSCPPDVADTCIVINLAEAFTLVLDHLRSRGATSLALYFSGTRLNADRHLAAFRAVAPDGFTWVYPDEDQPKGGARRVRGPGHRYELVYPEDRKATENIRRWLHSLPKPAGVVTLETGAAGFLLTQCRAAGLRVPEDVQLVGVDNTLISMAFEPHLTSLAPPRARIGEVAMETLLRYLRRKQPPPPPVIEVSGAILVARASTGLVHVGASAVAATLKLMETKKARGVSATQLARLSGVGRTTLYRQFLAATGSPPARHLRKVRMEEACRRLRQSPGSITAIAEVCGFNSLQAFSRSFRRETGRTPTVYRRESGVGGRQSGVGQSNR